MNERIKLKVEGMDCANCAQTITRSLKKEGFSDVNVEFITGDVTFTSEKENSKKIAENSIQRLGYKVIETEASVHHDHSHHHDSKSKIEKRFLISLFFTIPLFFHMLLPFSILHQPVFQLIVCLPVIIIGIIHFGKSAFYSLKAGVPNMDVLIFIGSTSAFIYSLAGTIMFYGTPEVNNYLFYETAATIITLVLLGNLIEQRSVRRTTSAITQLSLLQPQIAKRIVSTNGKEEIVSIDVKELKTGDVLLVNSGDRIPADAKIISGNATINESMLTGESRPAVKSIDDLVTAGTILDDGNLKIRVEHTGKDTALARIIELVKSAQHSKPKIQQLGDRISAYFVPIVLAISGCTFLYYFFFTDIKVAKALMNSIAVLVISCPCAMGLATPTAVMVGLGKAAKNGILIKGGSTIEELSTVKTIVFDKTGILTTGNFSIKKIECTGTDENTVREILFSLEKNSSHPIARSLQRELKSNASNRFEWKSIQEDKGIGINATDQQGDLYSAGSFQMVKHFHDDPNHEIYLLKNNKLIATIDLEDELKVGATEVINGLKKKGMRIVLLSGDRKINCETVANKLGITEVYSEKLPSEKLLVLDTLMKENPVAMVGDGINDAPALSKATVGISISDATEIAIQSAQVILLSENDLHILLRALRLCEMTFQTIKQNLFWAFFYNVIAIPVAAIGLLGPMVAALSMAFSDVIVIGNSLRLYTRKID